MKRLNVAAFIVLSLVLSSLLFTACMVKMEMEGDYVSPDSLRISMVVSFNSEESPEIEIVKIGDTVYVKDPENQQWVMADEAPSYQEFSGVENFISAAIDFINAFESPSLLDAEEINGVPCYHVKGTIDSSKMEDSSADFTSMDMGTVEAELWIDRENFLVRRMALEIQANASSPDMEMAMPGGGFSFIYDFSNYNEPITIDAPQITSS